MSVYLEAGIDFPEEDLELVPIAELSRPFSGHWLTPLTRLLGDVQRVAGLSGEGLATTI